MESCSACRVQILNQNQATSNLLVVFEFLRLLYPPECAGGGPRGAACGGSSSRANKLASRSRAPMFNPKLMGREIRPRILMRGKECRRHLAHNDKHGIDTAIMRQRDYLIWDRPAI